MKDRGIGWAGAIIIFIAGSFTLAYAISPQLRANVNSFLDSSNENTVVPISEMKENPSEYIGEKVVVDAYVLYATSSGGLLTNEPKSGGNLLDFKLSDGNVPNTNFKYSFTGVLQSNGDFLVTKFEPA